MRIEEWRNHISFFWGVVVARGHAAKRCNLEQLWQSLYNQTKPTLVLRVGGEGEFNPVSDGKLFLGGRGEGKGLTSAEQPARGSCIPNRDRYEGLCGCNAAASGRCNGTARHALHVTWRAHGGERMGGAEVESG